MGISLSDLVYINKFVLKYFSKQNKSFIRVVNLTVPCFCLKFCYSFINRGYKTADMLLINSYCFIF